MRRLFFIIISICCLTASYGQDFHYQDQNSNINGLKIGITPSALVNVYPGIQLNVTYGWNEKFQIENEWAYLIKIDPKTEGFRTRFLLKYYVHSRLFVAMGYHHRKTSSNRIETFSRFNNSFNQIIEYKLEKVMNGIPLMIGTTGDISTKISYDLAFGFGIGKILVTEPGVPEDAELVNDTSVFEPYSTSGKYNFPLLIANFKVQYKL